MDESVIEHVIRDDKVAVDERLWRRLAAADPAGGESEVVQTELSAFWQRLQAYSETAKSDLAFLQRQSEETSAHMARLQQELTDAQRVLADELAMDSQRKQLRSLHDQLQALSAIEDLQAALVADRNSADSLQKQIASEQQLLGERKAQLLRFVQSYPPAHQS